MVRSIADPRPDRHAPHRRGLVGIYVVANGATANGVVMPARVMTDTNCRRES